MSSLLLATLSDYLNLLKEYSSGCASEDELFESKKRVLQSLDEYIDYRLSLKFEERRRSMSQERISIADSINSNVKTSAATIKSLSALNAAPTPPTNASPEEMKEWLKVYNEWFEGQRKNGLNIS